MELFLMEWNIRGAARVDKAWNGTSKIQSWVADKIADNDADIKIITEFVVNDGIEYLFNKLRKNNNIWFFNSTTTNNGICIILNNEKFNISSNEIYKEEIIVSDIKNTNSPDYLQLFIKKLNLYIIGFRITSLLNEKNKDIQYTHKRQQYDIFNAQINDILMKNSNAKIIIGGDTNLYALQLKSFLNLDANIDDFGKKFENSDVIQYNDKYPTLIFKNKSKALIDHFICTSNIKTYNFRTDNWTFMDNNDDYIGVGKYDYKEKNNGPDHDIIYEDIKFNDV